MVDTSVLIAGISGFREPYRAGRNPSCDLLHQWAELGHFVRLVSEEILEEYKEILKRLNVRSNLIGAVINLLREEAEQVTVRSSAEISPDPKDDAFCLCAEAGKAGFLITPNPIIPDIFESEK